MRADSWHDRGPASGKRSGGNLATVTSSRQSLSPWVGPVPRTGGTTAGSSTSTWSHTIGSPGFGTARSSLHITSRGSVMHYRMLGTTQRNSCAMGISQNKGGGTDPSGSILTQGGPPTQAPSGGNVASGREPNRVLRTGPGGPRRREALLRPWAVDPVGMCHPLIVLASRGPGKKPGLGSDPLLSFSARNEREGCQPGRFGLCGAASHAWSRETSAGLDTTSEARAGRAVAGLPAAHRAGPLRCTRPWAPRLRGRRVAETAAPERPGGARRSEISGMGDL